jgi:hypothetical protein
MAPLFRRYRLRTGLLLLLVLLGTAGWWGVGVQGTGTPNFLPVWTGGAALGNSFWFQDTPNSNLLAPVGPGTIAADMASYIITVWSANVVVLDNTIIFSGPGPEMATVSFNGTYGAPTKSLAGDRLLAISVYGSSAPLTIIRGPEIARSVAVTDLDVALPIFLTQYGNFGGTSRDQLTVGPNAPPNPASTTVYLFGQSLSAQGSNEMLVGFNQANGSSGTRVSLGVDGNFPNELQVTANLVTLRTAEALAWSTDLFLTRGGAALLHLGALDAAAPVAQSLGVQNVVGGTTDTAGVLWNLIGSRGTGTGVGGDVAIQVAYPGTTASTQNTPTTVLDISASNKSTNAVQNLVSLTPIVNQSGTAGYNGLVVNVLRTAVGSGVKQLLALQIGGVQRFGVTDGATGVGLQLSAAQVTPPTCSANCGTTVPAVVGSDFSMIVTMGSGGVPTSPFTVTFNGTYPAIPSCQVVAKVTTTAFVTKVAPTQTTVVVTTATNPAVNDSYNVVCTPVV